MGGRPLTALAIAGFPEGRRPRHPVRRSSRAGCRRSQEAGVALLGGHTVQDQEIKFGYAVTGEVDPARIWTNAGRQGRRPAVPDQADRHRRDRHGDQVRSGAAGAPPTRRSRRWSRLNRAAAEALAQLPDGAVHACTDVTGFGLIGHATEMARASGVVVAIDVAAVPFLEGALDLVDGTPRAAGGPTCSTSAGASRRRPGWIHAVSSCSTTPRPRAACWSRFAPDAAAAAVAGAVRAPGSPLIAVGVDRSPAKRAVKGCRNLALNGINLRLACFRTCPSSGSFSSSWS